MKQNFISCIILIFCIFISGYALAFEDAIAERAYFKDSSNSLTIEQIQSQPFTYFEGVLNKGYSPAAFWVRLTVNHATSTEPLVLRVLPTYLDDIHVYQKLDGQWTKKIVGDTHAFNDREFLNTGFGVLVSPLAQDSHVYIRLKTTSTNLLSLELVDQKTFYSLEGKRDFAIGAYFGIAFIIFAFVTFHYLRKSSFLLNEFGLFLLIEILFILSLLGYLSRFIFPDNPARADFSTSLLVILFVFSATLFHRNFIKNELPVRPILWAFNICLLISMGLICALFISSDLVTILKINQTLGLVVCLIFISISLSYFFISAVSGYIALGYALLSLSILSGVLPNLGMIKAVNFSLYSTSYTGLLSAMLIAMLLIQRQSANEKAAMQTEHQLSLAKKEALFEKTLRERQNKFLTMLAHEMRTPLSVLKLVVNSISSHKLSNHADRAVNDMSMIIDRCLQMDRIDDALALLNKTKFDPLQVTREIIARHQGTRRIDVTVNAQVQEIYSDKTFFNIIISNLIENAVKYASARSKIEILIDAAWLDQQPCWKFSITNQAGRAGLPDTDQLFDKFYRGPKARNISGSGLGLYLVKSLLETLDGEIHYIPANKSVTFEVCLPI